MKDFWQVCEDLIWEQGLVIDRPKGSKHPRFPDLVYQLDYGYIKGTSQMDGSGIDVFVGDSRDFLGVIGIICTIDVTKKDSEIKILYNCTEENIQEAMVMMNNVSMKGILVRREQGDYDCVTRL